MILIVVKILNVYSESPIYKKQMIMDSFLTGNLERGNHEIYYIKRK